MFFFICDCVVCYFGLVLVVVWVIMFFLGGGFGGKSVDG